MCETALPVIDLHLEWRVLSYLHASYLSPTDVEIGDFTAERKLTWARIGTGTLTRWELAAFDLLPAVADIAIYDDVRRLRELASRRDVLRVTDMVDGGLRSNSMNTSEACKLLGQVIACQS